MISLTTSGSSIIFTFQDNPHYLQNGTIEVPKNSLLLVTDESNMATFKKSATNDIFLSALYSELGMTKSQLESWFKDNAVGGGGDGITSGEVQTMIDESISGKQDNSIALTQAEYDALVASGTVDPDIFYIITDAPVIDISNYYTSAETDSAIAAAVSGKADTVSAVTSAEYVSSSTTINFKNANGTVISTIDASDFVIDGMIDNVSIETISGASYLVIDFNTASGKEDIQIPLTDIFDPSNYYTKNDVDAALSGKVDVTTYTAYTSATDTVLSGKADTSAVTESINAAVSGKVDTSAITSSVTSASTDSEIPTAKAVYDAIPQGGGGSSYSAGTNIDITNDTINCTLPISSTTQNNDSHTIIFLLDDDTSNPNTIKNNKSKGNFIVGYSNHLGNDFEQAEYNIIFGNGNRLEGFYSNVRNKKNFVVGDYNFLGSLSSGYAVSNSAVFGEYNNPKNDYEYVFGKYNNSVSASTTFGDSGNTLFSVGNGTADNARHNAFEIRQNGDIYLNNGTSDVKLQDYIQIKSVKLTQAQYDALSPNYDANTLYIITNVVS